MSRNKREKALEMLFLKAQSLWRNTLNKWFFRWCWVPNSEDGRRLRSSHCAECRGPERQGATCHGGHPALRRHCTEPREHQTRQGHSTCSRVWLLRGSYETLPTGSWENHDSQARSANGRGPGNVASGPKDLKWEKIHKRASTDISINVALHLGPGRCEFCYKLESFKINI